MVKNNPKKPMGCETLQQHDDKLTAESTLYLKNNIPVFPILRTEIPNFRLSSIPLNKFAFYQSCLEQAHNILNCEKRKRIQSQIQDVANGRTRGFQGPADCSESAKARVRFPDPVL